MHSWIKYEVTQLVIRLKKSKTDEEREKAFQYYLNQLDNLPFPHLVPEKEKQAAKKLDWKELLNNITTPAIPSGVRIFL